MYDEEEYLSHQMLLLMMEAILKTQDDFQKGRLNRSVLLLHQPLLHHQLLEYYSDADTHATHLSSVCEMLDELL